MDEVENAVSGNLLALRFLSGVTMPINGDWLNVGDFKFYSDIDLEKSHNYIQWMFPTDQPSKYNSEAPIISFTDARRVGDIVERKIMKNVLLFTAFLSRWDSWRLGRKNHNHLRITRMLRCIYIFCGDAEAKHVYDIVYEMAIARCRDDADRWPEVLTCSAGFTIGHHWRAAITREGCPK